MTIEELNNERDNLLDLANRIRVNIDDLIETKREMPEGLHPDSGLFEDQECFEDEIKQAASTLLAMIDNK